MVSDRPRMFRANDRARTQYFFTLVFMGFICVVLFTVSVAVNPTTWALVTFVLLVLALQVAFTTLDLSVAPDGELVAHRLLGRRRRLHADDVRSLSVGVWFWRGYAVMRTTSGPPVLILHPLEGFSEFARVLREHNPRVRFDGV